MRSNAQCPLCGMKVRRFNQEDYDIKPKMALIYHTDIGEYGIESVHMRHECFECFKEK